MQRDRGLSNESIELLLTHALGPRRYAVDDRRKPEPLLRRRLVVFDQLKKPKTTAFSSTGKDFAIRILMAEANRLDPDGLGLPMKSPTTQPAAAPSFSPDRSASAPLSGDGSPAGERASKYHKA